MGAEQFFVRMKGQYKNADEAFREAVEEAQFECGHGGYTGTIAEKNDFKMVEVPKRTDPFEFALKCQDDTSDNFWSDKWGPAACVEVKGSYLQKMRGMIYKGKRNFHVYYFFGWASS